MTQEHSQNSFLRPKPEGPWICQTCGLSIQSCDPYTELKTHVCRSAHEAKYYDAVMRLRAYLIDMADVVDDRDGKPWANMEGQMLALLDEFLEGRR